MNAPSCWHFLHPERHPANSLLVAVPMAQFKPRSRNHLSFHAPRHVGIRHLCPAWIVPQPLRQFATRFWFGVAHCLLDCDELARRCGAKSMYASPMNAKRIAAQPDTAPESFFPESALSLFQKHEAA